MGLIQETSQDVPALRVSRGWSIEAPKLMCALAWTRAGRSLAGKTPDESWRRTAHLGRNLSSSRKHSELLDTRGRHRRPRRFYSTGTWAAWRLGRKHFATSGAPTHMTKFKPFYKLGGKHTRSIGIFLEASSWELGHVRANLGMLDAKQKGRKLIIIQYHYHLHLTLVG